MLAEYEILGVERGASRDEITAAYRRAAMRWHPDRNPDDPQAKERFQEIERAHRRLLQMTPQMRLAPEEAEAAAAATAAEVQAAVDAWRAERAAEQERRRRYEQQREAQLQEQEAQLAARRQTSSPLFTLLAFAAALAALALLIHPLGLIAASVLLFFAMLLAPKQPKTYIATVVALIATQGVRLYFVSLLAWFVWKMAQHALI